MAQRRSTDDPTTPDRGDHRAAQRRAVVAAASASTEVPGEMGEPTEQEPLPVGAMLVERYRILEHLGQGAIGDVYRALDTSLDEQVALKTLRTPLAEARIIAQFKEEVRTARRVTHPAVARTFDLGDSPDGPFITMELVPGESLRKRMRRGAGVGIVEALRVTRELALGLAAAHAAGVVHRDLKPGNVMCTPDGRVVIIDFGIALPVDAALISNDGSGTLAYMAPEQLTAQPLTPAVDVYALGLVLFEMIAGVRPFGNAQKHRDISARTETAAPPLSAWVPVDAALSSMVAECLSRDPGARPSAAAVAERLRNIPQPAQTRDDVFAERPITESEHVCTVAVLPLRAAAADDALAVTLAEELVDLLSRTRGARVLAASTFLASATRAQVINAGADVFIEGRLVPVDAGWALSARLVDADSGRVLMTHRAEARAGATLDAQHTLAQRVAEALRLGLAVHRRGEIPDEAMALYVRARGLVRQGARVVESEVVDAVDACLALAPGFAPALAVRALAVLRAWMVPQPVDLDWAAAARAAVGAALHSAPHEPETFVAAALLSQNDGDHDGARRTLEEALRIAPACVAAQEALGRLEIEAGSVAQGARRLRACVEIDPARITLLSVIARAAALRGNDAAVDRLMARVHHALGDADPEATLLQMRIALWRGDPSELNSSAGRAREMFPERSLIATFARAALARDPAALDPTIPPAASLAPRRLVLLHQLCAEVCASSDPAGAAAHVTAAASLGLVDVEWITHCPAIAPLAERDDVVAARRQVAQRAARVVAG